MQFFDNLLGVVLVDGRHVPLINQGCVDLNRFRKHIILELNKIVLMLSPEVIDAGCKFAITI